jgi:ABC-type transport system involved in multi-copper enzyme maturation permease subunit
MATEVSVKDVAGVRSRVSWGAILGGAMTAIAVFFLLSVLGTAIGASILYRQGETDISMGAAIWAVITLILALFCGGCVVSQCTAGETREESVIYGVILWGTLFTMLVALLATRVNVGFVNVMSTTLGTTQTVSTAAPNTQVRAEDAAAQQARDLAHDQRTVTAAWWTFGGILLSMLAAISGALTGAGPNFRLAKLGFRPLWTTHHQPGTPRTAV